MAETILVKETLTPEMIRDGRTLVEKFQQKAWPLSAAYWLFQSEDNEWRLVLVSPEAARRGHREGYAAAADIQDENPEIAIPRFSVRIASPKDEIASRITQRIRIDNPNGYRLGKTAIDGRIIDDAYIYKTS